MDKTLAAKIVPFLLENPSNLEALSATRRLSGPFNGIA
jgi:hypothetical protein